MRNPAEIVGDHLADPSSRRGFLATLGKLTLLGGATLAGLGGEEAYAACGPSQRVIYGINYGYACPSWPTETDSYAGCCKDSNGNYYETNICQHWDSTCNCYLTDCYYTFGPVGQNCPHVPAR